MESSSCDTNKKVSTMSDENSKSIVIEDLNLDQSNKKLDKKSRFNLFGYPLRDIKWSNVVFLLLMHALAVYGFVHAIIHPVKLWTVIFVFTIGAGSGLGMVVGAHRLWSHRSFKARWPLKLLLVFLQTMTVNGSVFSYCRDHRTHHKWSDTEADPKNPTRGFFYAHIGWWLLKKNSKVIEFGQKLNHDDILDDPLLRYQHRFYIPLVLIICFIIPTAVPVLLWNEDIITAFLVCVGIRTTVVLHHLWTVNSLAHIFGERPYDTTLSPRENRLVVYLSLGEGSHNYHHAFPYDYTTSDQKWYESFNPATLFIVIASLVGMTYDLNKPSKDVIHQFVSRKGDINAVEKRENRVLALRLVYGAFDWICGGIVTFWPLWIIILFKLIFHKNLIYL